LTAIGVLGGTFDPVHCGHVRLAIETREHLGLDMVRLMPAPNPRLREAPMASSEVRVRLVEAAIEGEPGLEVDQRELGREGPTYTVETLEELRAELPRASITLILGMDAFSRLQGWHRWEELTTLCHLAIACRPDSEPPGEGPVANLVARCATDDPAALKSRPAGLVHLCPVPILDISATRVRALRAAGRSTRCLVPDRVHTLLIEENLYNDA
jgi:nicotinate-nucleotide adenylyltransferase